MRASSSVLVVAVLVACHAGGSGDDEATSEATGNTVGSASIGTTVTTTTASTTSAGDELTQGDPSSTASEDAAGDSSSGGPPVASPGCGAAATPGATQRMIDLSGVPRSFALTIPDPYDPDVPRPLVFGFHGLGGTGAGYYIPGGLDPAPIIVGPDAEPVGGAWNTTGDLLLVDAILAAVGDELCVDLDRVFASGYSNGGFMADAVACQRSDVFRGVAVMEGGTSGGGACGPTAMWIMHNQDDMTVTLDYGTTLRDLWLATNGCAATTQPRMPDPCVQYDGCSAGNPVVWCSPATGGHNPNYDAAAAVPGFFQTL